MQFPALEPTVRHSTIASFALAITVAIACIAPCYGAAPAPQAAPSDAALPATSASATVITARERALEGNLAGAIALLVPYANGHPDDIAASRLLGDLYYRLPDFKKAEQTYLGILRRGDDRDTHTRLGGLYAAQDRIADAIGEFEKSLPVREGYAGLVELHRRLGDLGPFERELQVRADANRLDPIAQSNYANVLRAQRRYAQALPYFERQLNLRPRSCIALNEYGNSLIDNARLKEAIAALDACLAREPAFYPALVNEGEAYIELGRMDKGRTLMERALAARADGPEALIDLGYILDTQGQWRQAIGYYQRAIAIDPLSREAYIDLGFDYNERQLYTLAEGAFLRGLSVAPSDGRLNYLLAVTYALQGKTALARVQYQKALASDENDVVRAAKSDLAILQ